MESEVFEKFLIKIKEAEALFHSFIKEEQELGLKTAVSLCKRFELILGPAYSLSTYSLYATPGIEDFFKTLIATPEETVGSILDELVTKAVKCATEKHLPWPSTRFRERKTSTKFVLDDGLQASDSYSQPEDTDGYDSENCLGRKRKQKFPKRTVGQVEVKKVTKRGRKLKYPKLVLPDSVSTTKKDGNIAASISIETDTGEPHKNKITEESTSTSESTMVTAEQKENVTVQKENTKDKVERHFKLGMKLRARISVGRKKKRGRPPKRLVFSCEKCSETFTHQQSLRCHALEVHGDAPRSCRRCRKEFMGEIDPHHTCKVRLKNKGSRICRICGDEFSTFKIMRLHMKSEHGLKPRVPGYPCKYCVKSFPKRALLFSHYKEHAAEGEFVCIKCGQFSKTFEEYSAHVANHEKDAKFCCDTCGKHFDRAQQYDQHLEAHSTHTCSVCGESQVSRKSLMKHLRVKHDQEVQVEEKNHECSICEKRFARPGMLMVHLRLHTGEKPVECHVCKLFFRTNKALAKHKQTYTHCIRAGETAKERRFLCSECGKAYFRKHALQRHMRYHTGEKPHMCQYCGYKCREHNNLKRHMALHFEAQRNYVCEICGSAFHAKKTLEMHHAYKHSDIRAYKCPDCPLSFKAMNALRRHSKVHSVDKEHKCWCGTAFKRMYNLRRHLKSVHGTDEMLPPVRRVTTLDCTMKAPISKTDIGDKYDITHDATTLMREASMLLSPTMVPLPEPTGMGTPGSGAMSVVLSDVQDAAAPHTPDTHPSEALRYNTPVSLSDTQQQHIDHPLNPDPSHPPDQHPASTDTLTQHSLNPEDPAEKEMRYIHDPSGAVYAAPTALERPLDPNDPYLQSGGNVVPQAVAYSSIMREYGAQFQFLQDGTIYSHYVK